MGVKADWTGEHRLALNGSGLNTYEIPYEFGLEYRVSSLMAAPLVFRFGKALIPKPKARAGVLPINRWIETWKSLGFNVTEEEKFIKVSSGNLQGTVISFKTSTHSGTDNAIISSLFVPGETIINNAAEEAEVDDLIEFANLIGGSVERIEPRKIRIEGTTLFKGGRFEVQPDKNEAVIYAVGSVMTNGNITIEKVEKSQLTSFINVMTKMGCKYEFYKDSVRIWSSGEELLPVNINTSPAPGFMTDWQALITVLLTKVSGESLVHDTVYTDRFGYIKDLNRMGARIDLARPSDAGLSPIISDDSYNLEEQGEPYTVAKIHGPVKLKGTRINVTELSSATALIVAALSAEGRSEVGEVENLDRLHEGLLDRLTDLGAKIS
jgi:UDP-N-acetylglucosamine 1-carboxyvinyltransferase